MSGETQVHLQADVLLYTEGNMEERIGELKNTAATSETYSCCTKLRCQLGRAYNVHGSA